jgi:hypothetical protein
MRGYCVAPVAGEEVRDANLKPLFFSETEPGLKVRTARHVSR